MLRSLKDRKFSLTVISNSNIIEIIVLDTVLVYRLADLLEVLPILK